MKRDRLEQLFARATERALDAARRNVWNEIPDTVRYNFFPNQSYDLEPDGQSRTTHPEESLPPGQYGHVCHLSIRRVLQLTERQDYLSS